MEENILVLTVRAAFPETRIPVRGRFNRYGHVGGVATFPPREQHVVDGHHEQDAVQENQQNLQQHDCVNCGATSAV